MCAIQISFFKSLPLLLVGSDVALSIQRVHCQRNYRQTNKNCNKRHRFTFQFEPSCCFSMTIVNALNTMSPDHFHSFPLVISSLYERDTFDEMFFDMYAERRYVEDESLTSYNYIHEFSGSLSLRYCSFLTC